MSETIQNLMNKVRKKAAPQMAIIDEIALENQRKVLNAFRLNRVADRHFKGSTGYGYDDIGRDTLCRLYADVFHAEAALVSPLITGGTHALVLALFGLLRPGDTLLSITGAPYDTLLGVIGAGAAFGLEWVMYDALVMKIQEVDSLQLFSFVPFVELLEPMLITFSAAGLFVGVLGSLMAIRKFLDV